MEQTAYKRLHLAWISSNTGSTPEDALIAILPLPLMVFLAGATHFLNSTFLREIVLLIVPACLSLTQSSYLPVVPVIAIGVLSACWFFRASHQKAILLTIVACLGFTAYAGLLIPILGFLWLLRKRQASMRDIVTSSIEERPAWITNFRACTSVITVICILAVDLNIFPRKFAKTEIYGFGLMDLGVGMYMICNGLVRKQRPRSKDFKEILVLLLLGLIRLISLKATGYHEHITEYGVHWNFFFTLAVCQIISALMPFYNALILTMTTAYLHTAILSLGGQDWVFSDRQRDNFLDANREGIVSILGYVTIYYGSIAYMNSVKNKSTSSVLKRTFILALISWKISCHVTMASRRLCNIGYIAWTFFVAFSVLVVLICIDILLQWESLPRVPRTLDAINRRGLLYFLLGNVFTGMVNLNMQTLLLSSEKSYALLFLYITLVTFFVYFLDKTLKR